MHRTKTHNPDVQCEVFSPRPRSAAGGADEVNIPSDNLTLISTPHLSFSWG